MEILELTPEIAAARDRWRYRGQQRPPFAEPVLPGQESVWDFPRPPVIQTVDQRLRVQHADEVIAATTRGVRVLETAGAPTYYFPPEDVSETRLRRTPDSSLCEWKGLAASFALDDIDPAAWRYHTPFAEFSAICNWYAFYPARLACYIGDERVMPQPGGYYGGWVSAWLRGPIKGDPGTGHW